MIDPNPASTPPQTGRTAKNTGFQSSLWTQILSTLRDMGGVFDPFVNDSHPDVRALGRQALHRRTPDDNFMLGDLCAWLTLQHGTLNHEYANKAITAYARAGEGQTDDAWAARDAMLNFFNWCAATAMQLDHPDSLRTAVHVGDMMLQLGIVTARSPEHAEMQQDIDQLRNAIQGQHKHEPVEELHPEDAQARTFISQGQDFLRRYQPAAALSQFEQAVAQGISIHPLWLWRAVALTDLGRFADALASYDKALELEPDNAGTWNAKGALLLELGQLKEAKHAFDEALAHNTSNAAIAQCIYMLNRGKALFMLGDYQNALHDLERSAEIEPTSESVAGIAACREQIARQRASDIVATAPATP